jgi:hypothetical protein
MLAEPSPAIRAHQLKRSNRFDRYLHDDWHEPRAWCTGAANDQILEFGAMVGVAGPFRGPTNNIRGVNGAGAAWRLTEAKGELGKRGWKIRVRGLVLVTTGFNPVPNLRAIVSCLTTDSSATVVATSNIVTDPSGDAGWRCGYRSSGRPPEPVYRTDRVRHQRGRHIVVLGDGALTRPHPARARHPGHEPGDEGQPRSLLRSMLLRDAFT